MSTETAFLGWIVRFFHSFRASWLIRFRLDFELEVRLLFVRLNFVLLATGMSCKWLAYIFCLFLPVFLILCYINEVLAIMKAADSLDMTNGDYAFITLDLNTDVFYKDGQWTGNEGKDSTFPNVLNGIIDLSVYRPELSEDFKKKYQEMIENQLEPSIKRNLHPEVKLRHV